MKTTSKIFSLLFLAIAICAGLAALGGATHQWYLAAVSLFISVILSPEIIAKQPER